DYAPSIQRFYLHSRNSDFARDQILQFPSRLGSSRNRAESSEVCDAKIELRRLHHSIQAERFQLRGDRSLLRFCKIALECARRAVEQALRQLQIRFVWQ